MSCSGSWSQSPFFWIFLAAVVLGFAIHTAVRASQRRSSGRITVASILATIAIVLGLLAVFVPGPESIVDLRVVMFAGSACLFGVIVALLPKVVGIPLLLLGVASLSLPGILAGRWLPGDLQPIASIRPVIVTPDAAMLRLEIDGDVNTAELSSQAIQVEISVVSAEPYFFTACLGGYVRQLRLVDAEEGRFRYDTGTETASYRKRFAQVVERALPRLPGWRVSEVAQLLPSLRELHEYRVFLSDDSELMIRTYVGDRELIVDM